MGKKIKQGKKDWSWGSYNFKRNSRKNAGLIEKETFEYLSGSYLGEECFRERT